MTYKELLEWAQEANIPSQHVIYCINKAIKSEYIFDNISEFVQYLYTVKMETTVWKELFRKWNVTLSSYLTRPRETVRKVLYRGISRHRQCQVGDRFRLYRNSYSTKKKVAARFAKKWGKGAILTVRGPKVTTRFTKSFVAYEYEYLMAGSQFGTVTSVTYHNGLQYIQIFTEN